MFPNLTFPFATQKHLTNVRVLLIISVTAGVAARFEKQRQTSYTNIYDQESYTEVCRLSRLIGKPTSNLYLGSNIQAPRQTTDRFIAC
jgi:hypothetical protein